MHVNIISKRRAFDGFFKVDELELEFEKFNGEMSRPVRRLVFERGDSVTAVLFNRDTKRLMFTRQFKAPSYEKGPGWITEIVAGIIDPGESPDDALRREIFEETTIADKLLTRAINYLESNPGGRIHSVYFLTWTDLHLDVCKNVLRESGKVKTGELDR